MSSVHLSTKFELSDDDLELPLNCCQNTVESSILVDRWTDDKHRGRVHAVIVWLSLAK